MNPWQLLGNMLAWSLVAIVAVVIITVVVAFIIAGVRAVVKPRKRGKATQIYSSGDD